MLNPAAMGYQSCVLCHGHPHLGWVDLAAVVPEITAQAPQSQLDAVANTDWKLLDARYRVGATAYGKLVAVDGPAILGSLAASSTGAGAGIGIPALWVSLDRAASDLTTLGSHGQVDRPTLTTRTLVDCGTSREQAKALEDAILTASMAAAAGGGGLAGNGGNLQRAERIAGYDVLGSARQEGNVFTRVIVSLRGPMVGQNRIAGSPLRLRAFFQALANEARAAGATQLRIRGAFIQNDLESVRKLGFP